LNSTFADSECLSRIREFLTDFILSGAKN
jgi:hypothetical protein